VDRSVTTLITQVIVDPDDPATREPTKPIGNVLKEGAARQLARDFGWKIARSKEGWRRVVPSPRPIAFVEREQIAALVREGSIVIAGGGGGTPVYVHPQLGLEGVDAVIDKDRAAAVLARSIQADALLILTNVDGVYVGFGTPEQRRLERIDAAEARTLLDAGEFGEGSMKPKVEAAIDFVRAGGHQACIARLDHGLEAVGGFAGTTVIP
jgi:carbamate kinase